MEEGFELSQPEVEAFIEADVKAFLAANAGSVSVGSLFDVPFILESLDNIPWAYRVFIVSDLLISISTYFPITR